MDIFQVTRAYQSSALLFALVELDLCTHLAQSGQPLSAAELAAQTGLPLPQLEPFMLACAALGILDYDPHSRRFVNTALSADHLVAGAPADMRKTVLSHAGQARRWLNLADGIRSSAPVLAVTPETGEDNRAILLGLHAGGKKAAERVAELLAPYLTNTDTVLDVGGGTGLYSIALLKAIAGLRAIVQELPDVAPLSREIIAQEAPADVLSRITVREGDFLDDALPSVSVILFSQVLRTVGGGPIQTWLARAAVLLPAGGLIAINDALLDDSRTTPVENVIHHLAMSVMYPEGGLFSLSDLTDWLAEAGFATPVARPVISSGRITTLVTAQRLPAMSDR